MKLAAHTEIAKKNWRMRNKEREMIIYNNEWYPEDNSQHEVNPEFNDNYKDH